MELGIWVDLWQCQADCSTRMVEVVPRNGASLASRVFAADGGRGQGTGLKTTDRYAEREL